MSIPAGRPRAVWLLLSLAVACDAGGFGSGSLARVPELDPCGGSEHPCTLAGVSPEARARTGELAQGVLQYLNSASDLEQVAAWLARQEGVVSVATGPEAVRYRVRGGRGHWIFVRTAGTVATLGAPGFGLPHRAPSPPVEIAPVSSKPPAPVHPPVEHGGGSRLKKALLLSPFRWQWELEGGNDGMDEVARALRARDYVDVTLWTERLDPASPDRTIGEIGLSAFTTWNQYRYIHLLTHGGRACDAENLCVTTVMTPWSAEMVSRARAGAKGKWWYPLLGMSGGNSDLAELLDRVGVETARVRIEGVAPDQIPYPFRPDPLPPPPDPALPKPKGSLTGEIILLTPAFFRNTYQQGLDSAVVLLSACSSGHVADLMSALQGEHTVVIGWKDRMSLRAAAAAGVLVAKTLVEVDEDIEDDSGLTVEQAMIRIRERLWEVATNPPSEGTCTHTSDPETITRCEFASKAKVLSVINDMPADPLTGASLVLAGDSTVRAREIVYLIDQAGSELMEGSVLPVVGLAGDAVADSTDLRIRVDGLALEADPSAIRLEVLFEGRVIDVHQPLQQAIAAGVRELEYRLPLGRDHQDGETITMEVATRFPDGRESRWVYEDIRLGGSYWRLTIGGTRAGTYAGFRMETSSPFIVYSPYMPADELRRWGFGLTDLILNSDDGAQPNVVIHLSFDRREPGAGIHRPGTYQLEPGSEIVFEADRLLRGDFKDDPGWVSRSHRQYVSGDGMVHGGGRARPPPPAVNITSIDYDWVAGTIDGNFWTLRGDGTMHDEVSVQLEFRARRCLAVNKGRCVAVPDSLR